MSTDIQKAARKIGLGFRPEEDLPDSLSNWIDEQLQGRVQFVGYEYLAARPAIVPWPVERNPSLVDRVKLIQEQKRGERKLESEGVSGADYGRALSKLYVATHTEPDDMRMFAHSGVFAKNQLRQRLTWFWANHFTVGKNPGSNNNYIGHYLEHAIEAALDGSFADMTYGMVTHPAMTNYLDNVYNVGRNSTEASGRCDCVGPNDNLGRELLELHTVSPARGYLEEDVRNAANILTGWGHPVDWGDPFIDHPDWWQTAYFPKRAEPGQKTVLSRTYPSGQGALRQLVDDLSADPATADFVSRKLIAHFIGEDGTEDDVSAVKEVWGSTNGSLPAIHRVVLDRALKAPQSKFLWPIIWLMQAQRITGATIFDGFAEAGRLMSSVERNTFLLFRELGQSFWDIRQPDGFSDAKASWVSTEHFDRRLRFAAIMGTHGSPELTAQDVADKLGYSPQTRKLIERGQNELQRFVLALTVREFMEA